MYMCTSALLTGVQLIIITFANSKGGVGKSTACLAIAGAYAKFGLRVHICDLDGNKTVSRWLANDRLAEQLAKEPKCTCVHPRF